MRHRLFDELDFELDRIAQKRHPEPWMASARDALIGLAIGRLAHELARMAMPEVKGLLVIRNKGEGRLLRKISRQFRAATKTLKTGVKG